MNRLGRPTLESQNPALGDHIIELYQEHRSIRKVAQTLQCGRVPVERVLKTRGITIYNQCDRDFTFGQIVACAGCGFDRTVNMSRGYRPFCHNCRQTLGDSRLGTGIRCGTVEGHRQHSTYGQPPCKPCRRAVRGIETPAPFPKCECGNLLIRANQERCLSCRKGPVTIHEGREETEPVIQWVKDRHGIYRGIVRYEPQPDSTQADNVPDGAAGYDEARVQRRMLGDRSIRLHKGESEEVVRRLLARRWTANQIRRHTGLQPDRYLERAA